MTVAGVLLALAVGTAPEGDLSAHIREAATRAEALHGPLDGRWALRDAHGVRLYEFQITDPPPGSGPPSGAWRQLGGKNAYGAIAGIEPVRGAVIVRFDATDGGGVWLRVDDRGRPPWRGRLYREGRVLPVRLDKVR